MKVPEPDNMIIILPTKENNCSYGALRKVLNLFYRETEVVLVQDSHNFIRSDLTIGLLIFENEDDFFLELKSLIEISCKCLVVLTWWKNSFNPCQFVPPQYLPFFNEKILATDFKLANILCTINDSIRRARKQKYFREKDSQLLRIINARELYKLILNFLHGTEKDLTNSFLAPLRLLIQITMNENYKDFYDKLDLSAFSEDLLTEFNCCIIKKIEVSPDVYGALGQEILTCWKPIAELSISEGMISIESMTKKSLNDIERLMDLLTEVRFLSGATINQQDYSKDENLTPDPIDSKAEKITFQEIDDKEFRILVIDDHSKFWYPIFQAIAYELLKRGKSVIIEFSADARTVKTFNAQDDTNSKVTKPLFQLLADYDLVLLDIFLPGENGIDILKRIRERLLWLPVIMWTSSQRKEYPSSTALANGFIFKKSSDFDPIVDIIDSWLVPGIAKRETSLMNQFFDHVINTPDIRKCALDFSLWCLRLLDGFHALDNKFFMFFTDHGGRHIFGLLNILEKLLRPFLFESEAHLAIFSKDPKEREIEFLYIYIASLCHELGMFPLKNENYEGIDKETLQKNRKLHAIRGFTIFTAPKKQQLELNALLKRLDAITPIGSGFIGLITLYHSRTLKLEEFGEIGEEVKEDIQKHFPDSERMNMIQTLNDSLANVMKLLPQQKEFKDKIIRICSLFRFADAIDIDHTRAPAEFLLKHEDRSIIDDRENFKRQIIDKVSIDRGALSIYIRSDTPDPDEVFELVNRFIPNESALIQKANHKLSEEFDRYLKDPLSYHEPPTPVGHLKVMQKKIDKLLETIFKEFRKNNDLEFPNGAFCMLTALSIIAEIRDEYEAIIISRLQQIIVLKEIIWLGFEGYSELLTIIKKH